MSQSPKKMSWHWIVCLTFCPTLCLTSLWHHLLLPTSPHSSGVLHVLTAAVGLCISNKSPVCLPISMVYPYFHGLSHAKIFPLLATLSSYTHIPKPLIPNFCRIPFFPRKHLVQKQQNRIMIIKILYVFQLNCLLYAVKTLTGIKQSVNV